MEINDTDKRELKECISKLRALLARQTRLIEFLLLVISKKEGPLPAGRSRPLLPKVTGDILPVLIQSAGSSCLTIIRLTSRPGLPIRDCFPIARAIVETIINICYILARGEEAAERMEKHALQKTYRNLDRSSSISGTKINLRYTGHIDPSDVPGLQESLKAFSTAKGNEKRLWTEDSIEQRLSEISTRFGTRISTPLHFAHFAIYRNASEILHGTYFGWLYFFGATQPGIARSRENTRYAVSSHAMDILFNLVRAIDAMIQALDAVASLPPLALASTSLTNSLMDIPYFKRLLDNQSFGKPQPGSI
jgi:hypothetical protein